MISLEHFTALAHRTASRYSHRSEPEKVAYTFLPHTLADFHRQVCAAARDPKLTDSQMDEVIVALGKFEREEIGFNGLVSEIVGIASGEQPNAEGERHAHD
jgi:hypothetical protein